MPKIKFVFSKCIKAVRENSYEKFKDCYEGMSIEQLDGIRTAFDNNETHLYCLNEFEKRWRLNQTKSMKHIIIPFVDWLSNVNGITEKRALRFAFRDTKVNDWEMLLLLIAKSSIIWRFCGDGASDSKRLNAKMTYDFKLENTDGDILLLTPAGYADDPRHYINNSMDYVIFDKDGKHKVYDWFIKYYRGEENENITKHFKFTQEEVNAFVQWMDIPYDKNAGNKVKLVALQRGSKFSSRFMREISKISKTWRFIENVTINEEIKYFKDASECQRFLALFKNEENNGFMIRVTEKGDLNWVKESI